jgi:hypothetical protein
MVNNNDVSDWSISFVTSYLIGQSFCVSIGQLFMKWSFLIGSFSSILIGGWAIDTLKYRVWAPQGQHNGQVKFKTMAWSKAYENRKKGKYISFRHGQR